jgi:phage terminase large subunit-like protein
MVDGEGHVSGSRRLNICQSMGKNQPIVDRLDEVLTELGLSYRRTVTKHPGRRDKVDFDIRGVGPVYRTLLRQTPLAKRDQVIDALYDGAGRTDRHADRVESIGNPVDEDVFALQTGTGNYVAWGYASSNSYLTASMYQQRPSPEEGGDIKRAWFRIEDALPPRFDTAISSWDMKLKDKETGDYVVGQYWGRTGKDFWLGDQLRGQWNQATTEAAIALMAVRHPDIRAHHIENTGNGPEVMEALRSSHPGYTVSDDVAGQLGMGPGEADAVNNLRRRGMGALLPVIVKGSKGVRLRAVSGYMEAGDVHLLKRDYIGAYLEEMASFPQGAHDDQCDATSQALSKLARGSATVTRAAGSIPKAPINTRQGTTAARTGRVVTPRTGGY